jgi:hypothetical protein
MDESTAINANVPTANAERLKNRNVSAGNVIINIRNVFHLRVSRFAYCRVLPAANVTNITQQPPVHVHWYAVASLII